jgi:hypothetical protein
MNQAILSELTRENSNNIEKTAQASNEYIRLGLREDSFAMKILPPEQATDDMLDRGMQEGLSITIELEPDSPGAKFVPFQTVPDAEYIESTNFRIPFARLLTPKFQKDIDELRTYKMDIRKVLVDNSIKDGLATIDGKLIETVNSIIFNCDENGRNIVTGKKQLMDFYDPLNRETFAEAKKLLPRGNADGKFNLRNYICLMNDVTAQDLLKLDRKEVGGDLAQEMFKNGLTMDTIMGVKCLFTIKSALVPDNYVYFFAAPEFLGKAYYLDDWTMFMKKEAYFIEMYSYWTGGFGIGNIAGVALARFNQTSKSGTAPTLTQNGEGGTNNPWSSGAYL